MENNGYYDQFDFKDVAIGTICILVALFFALVPLIVAGWVG